MSATHDDKPRDKASVFVLAMALAALAGFIDATGYIHFQHLFVSFMSGNSTQAMVAAAQEDGPKFATVGRTILLFVAGVAIGELIGSTSKRWGRPLVLALEVALLGLSLLAVLSWWNEAWTASALALAMGVQNAAVHRAEGISVALTYVTGTLVHVGRGIAAALRGTAPWHAPLPFVGLWLGLAIGGFLGAIAADRSLVSALAIAFAAGTAMLAWAIAAAIVAREPA